MSNDFTQAQAPPWRYGFLNLMRRVDVQLCTVPAGNTWQPRMEKFRLGQTPALTFAPREIASVGWQEGRLHISLYSLGLWGRTVHCRCTTPNWRVTGLKADAAPFF
ncbi:periplasmic chaperone of fimbral assembly machinery [Shigella flexneri 5 str. 8401]|uniref:Periplasmic chaperone of fimbral assembly machinery n=1 Tax=Shigella flexneri serotype 5b (strain 8401) TaxID=373384 RepID=Q0T7Z6_SHIF8|nr:periplasmic chaperone of fimbral assembly machinery [Shigella flexneri 5 str. 8401]